mmetsp:Transcript_72554/g.121890  ORF Transcript_72554/g.121890 Transcript_72554/m.121890 type:complete len:216 (-) Transcript_72554:43-690(-)
MYRRPADSGPRRRKEDRWCEASRVCPSHTMHFAQAPLRPPRPIRTGPLLNQQRITPYIPTPSSSGGGGRWGHQTDGLRSPAPFTHNSRTADDYNSAWRCVDWRVGCPRPYVPTGLRSQKQFGRIRMFSCRGDPPTRPLPADEEGCATSEGRCITAFGRADIHQRAHIPFPGGGGFWCCTGPSMWCGVAVRCRAVQRDAVRCGSDCERGCKCECQV